jgi:hypothetical protein
MFQKNNRSRQILAGAMIIFIAVTGGAEADGLANSVLYEKTAKDCRPVDLAQWSHPTRTVLRQAGVVLLGVQLCNDAKYPIFTVKFKYDPEGQTDRYFDPLYVRMGVANGYFPFSFVDEADREIVDVHYSRDRRLKIDYEQY